MTLKSQPFVSILTPVYNTEKYLAQCIDSVLAQRYENWEYVIVNNCSTDRSLEIAQGYARKDNRIRICSNDEFLSLMQNWNHAMHQISPESKYCKVVHADDWLFPECVMRMVEVAEAHPSIGIVGAYRLDEDLINLDGLPYPSTFVSGREVCRQSLLGGSYIFGSPTSLLIRSDLIRTREQFYNESNIHADQEVCFDILQNSDFGFVHQVLTFTRRHNETHTTFLNRLKTRRLGHLIVLIKYGPIYLKKDEYEEWVSRSIMGYHRFLAKNMFNLEGKEFWDFHKDELKRLGHPISLLKFIRAFLSELLDFRSCLMSVKKAMKNKQRKMSI